MKIFHKLVDVKEARDMISTEIEKLLKTREVNIEDSTGYVTSQEVYSRIDVPSFDRSEVDGYAVYHTDVEGADESRPAKLNLQGSVMAGDRNVPELKNGNAIYVATGAIIPRGSDGIVMVEDTRSGDKDVEIFRSVYPGENISFAGTDFSMGALLLPSRVVVSPEHVGTLAAAGVRSINVYSPIRVGIFSTGNEIIPPGSDIEPGQVFDTNSFYFSTRLLATHLVTASYLGIVKDNEADMRSVIENNSGNYDVLIGSGSTSAGFYDMLYRIFESSGGEILFHGINIKPGKPTFFGKLGRSVFVGMPGFPLSSAVILNYLLIPAIRGAMEKEGLRTSTVRIPYRINSEKSQEMVIPVILTHDNFCFPISGNSGSISRILYADGLAVISSGARYVAEGDLVNYLPINENTAGIISIGSSDPLLEKIILSIDKYAKIINAGSFGGVSAMRSGAADISGIHILLHGVYNLSAMDSDLSQKCVLIRGFKRNRGFVSRTGVSGFDEIIKDNLMFVNRNKGSGTRDLIEEILSDDTEKRRNIRGYLWETNTEAGVARAVLQGRADAGISLEYYAKILGLKYVQVKEEEYDILISKRFYDSALGKEFIKLFDRIGDYMADFHGYRSMEDSGKVIFPQP